MWMEKVHFQAFVGDIKIILEVYYKPSTCKDGIVHVYEYSYRA